jgi:hypothetical protein
MSTVSNAPSARDYVRAASVYVATWVAYVILAALYLLPFGVTALVGWALFTYVTFSQPVPFTTPVMAAIAVGSGVLFARFWWPMLGRVLPKAGAALNRFCLRLYGPDTEAETRGE